MNRRTFIGTSAVAGVGVATTAFQCNSKPKAVVITIITGAIADLKIIFPDLPILNKISALAVSFKAAWDAGKLADARTFFTNLDTLVAQVIADLGINASTRVKLILASLGIGVRVIAALISEQATPEAMAAAGPATVDRVTKLADPKVADALLKAVQPQ